jgi:hypothetical protein
MQAEELRLQLAASESEAAEKAERDAEEKARAEREVPPPPVGDQQAGTPCLKAIRDPVPVSLQLRLVPDSELAKVHQRHSDVQPTHWPPFSAMRCLGSIG